MTLTICEVDGDSDEDSLWILQELKSSMWINNDMNFEITRNFLLKTKIKNIETQKFSERRLTSCIKTLTDIALGSVTRTVLLSVRGLRQENLKTKILLKNSVSLNPLLFQQQERKNCLRVLVDNRPYSKFTFKRTFATNPPIRLASYFHRNLEFHV